VAAPSSASPNSMVTAARLTHDDAASRHDSNLVCVCVCLCVRWCALISFGECVCFECECVCACVCVVLFLFILQPSSDNVGLPLTQLQWKAI